MLQHLDSAYKDSFPDVDQIQNQRNAICSEIRDFITTHFDPIPHKPSFDMLINSQIKKHCPNLNRIKDLDLGIDSNNFYSSNKICQMVFDVVSGYRRLDMTINLSPVNGYDLLDKRIKTIARGDKASILMLKTILERLVSNDQISTIVSRKRDWITIRIFSILGMWLPSSTNLFMQWGQTS
jgi:hypothetical protein